MTTILKTIALQGLVLSIYALTCCMEDTQSLAIPQMLKDLPAGIITYMRSLPHITVDADTFAHYEATQKAKCIATFLSQFQGLPWQSPSALAQMK